MEALAVDITAEAGARNPDTSVASFDSGSQKKKFN